MNRWFVYQRERFPIAAHAPLVAAFSGSAVCLSEMLRGRIAAPAASSLVVAFVTSLLFFLQLRIADEFKDFEEDSRYRPYRAVPRGLVKLSELRLIGVVAAAIQLALALWLSVSLLPLLALAWIYLVLMTREFFVGAWLRARPVVYMLSHMMIVPLVDLYASACDWRVAGLSGPPSGLMWFLVLSYCNGLVIEMGRKIRAPVDEETGVQTYSAIWGRPTAIIAWYGAMGATAMCALQVVRRIDAIGVAALLVFLLSINLLVALRFLGRTEKGAGKAIEAVSGIWTVLMYLSVGAGPLVYALWKAARTS